MAENVRTMNKVRPFCKWAGGKNYLLPQLNKLLDRFPHNQHTYIEPMVGGGAVLYEIGGYFPHCIINDINPDLINLYKVIQNRAEALIVELDSPTYAYKHKSDPASLENYRMIRSSAPTDPVRRAARILFLLKTCFNGLMRVNQSGQFNTPPGSYEDPIICNAPLLRDCSRFLRDVEILDPTDAVTIIRERASQQTFLVIDPPYHAPNQQGADNGGKFTDYSGVFGEAEQAALVEAVLASDAPFVYTNRATEFILDLFPASVFCEIIELRHSIQPVYTTGLVEWELIAYRF